MLPPPVKRLMIYADQDYCCWPFEDFIDRHGEAEGTRIAALWLRAERQKLVLKHYGLTHPQVRG